MPDWLVMLLVAVIAATGGWATAFFQSRKNASDDRQALVDELQEERTQAKTEAARDRDAFMAQVDRFWTDKAASREHVAALRDHIWQRKPPPPPEAPEGYIP